MRSSVNELNPSGQRFHIESITVSAGVNSTAERIYWPHLPILESAQIVGLVSLSAFAGPNGNPGNISPNTVNPGPSQNVSSFNYLLNLFVTIVNKKGETLFDRIPYSTIFPFNGKIKLYNAVNIDTRKCFFSFAAGTIISGNVTAQMGFLLNYEQ